jgi:hypothetical protein
MSVMFELVESGISVCRILKIIRIMMWLQTMKRVQASALRCLMSVMSTATSESEGTAINDNFRYRGWSPGILIHAKVKSAMLALVVSPKANILRS